MNHKIVKMLSLSISLLWVVGCGPDPPSAPLRQTIHGDFQAFHWELDSNPKALRRTVSGDFLIAASTSTALAAMTNSQGILKWQYKEPTRGGLGFDLESEFNDAVSLENDSVLFCGTKLTEFRRGAGLVMTFDGNGKKLEERDIAPNDGSGYVDGNFHRCFLWNDGIALVGEAQEVTGRVVGWIVKLDRSGAKKWEVLDRAFVSRQAVPMQDGGMAVSVYDLSVHLSRLDERGAVTAHRDYPGSAGALLKSTLSTNDTYLLVYQPGGLMWFYVLDDNFHEKQTPIQLHHEIDVTSGCGYVRADGSLVLFGRSNGASRALFDKRGAFLDAKSVGISPSFTMVDAAPIGENRFVSIRHSDGPARKDVGLMMLWDDIK